MKNVHDILGTTPAARAQGVPLQDDTSWTKRAAPRATSTPSPTSGTVHLRVVPSSDDEPQEERNDFFDGSPRGDRPVKLLPEPAPEVQAGNAEHIPFSAPSLRETGRRLAGLTVLLEDRGAAQGGGGTSDSGCPPGFDLLKGMIWHACVVTVDELFEDLMAFNEDLSAQGRLPGEILVLPELPPLCMDKVNGFFTRKFLTAVVDVTNHLTHEWRPLPTVAHALALRILLNKTEFMAEIFEVDLPATWRPALEELLYDGLDLEPLYDSSAATDADAIRDFASWFTPLSPGQRVTPFAAS